MQYNFKDDYINREKRFAIGKELYTEKYYFCFPVKLFLAEYDEYYEISEDEYHEFFVNQEHILVLLERARKRLEDHRLMFELPKIRGIPD
ncbi:MULTISPECIES: hypothetical protein [unclassified Acinetobacter]|uniref:hypothetical protein n=1 Tax=unclassified Acinetobacter TaxID=196816 RepID=UPI0035B91EEA